MDTIADERPKPTVAAAISTTSEATTTTTSNAETTATTTATATSAIARAQSWSWHPWSFAGDSASEVRKGWEGTELRRAVVQGWVGAHLQAL